MPFGRAVCPSLLISGNINDDNGQESLTLNGDGSGRLVLSGTNTYGGGTIVAVGAVAVCAYAWRRRKRPL